MQAPLFSAKTEWCEPTSFPDLSSYDEIAIDLETKDPDLVKKRILRYTRRRRCRRHCGRG